MTLDGLLALAGILVAILAIANPVQRRSILLFIPRTILLVALITSVLAVVYLRTGEMWGTPLPQWSQFILYSGSFLLPVLAVVACLLCWHRAHLTKNKVDGFRDVVYAAMREGTYDELDRILVKNQQRLNLLGHSTLHAIFARKVVRALLDARSYLHLELLTHIESFDSAGTSQFLFVDNVVRELLLSPNSPWRSAVIWNFGGHDCWPYLEEEQKIVQQTLENPAWYVDAGAHAPLTMAAIETIQSRRLDVDYNQIGRAYESREGISPRVNCPVFLAVRMEMLAIKAAIRQHSDADLYVRDLWNIFRTIRDHSVYNSAVWKSPLANSEFPTPYAYLLHEIFYGLRELVWETLSTSVERPNNLDVEEQRQALEEAADTSSQGEDDIAEHNSRPKKEVKIKEPAYIDCQVAQAWALCAREMASAKDKVGRDFRIDMICECLNLALKLHNRPSDIPGLGNVMGLEPWRDLFLKEVTTCFTGAEEKQALERAFRNLDPLKMYVVNGRNWLAEQLNITLD
jgi:hypothetical protein